MASCGSSTIRGAMDAARTADANTDGSPSDVAGAYDGIYVGSQPAPSPDAIVPGSDSGSAADATISYDGFFPGVAPIPPDASTSDAAPYDGRLLGVAVRPPDAGASISVGAGATPADHIAVGGPQRAPALPDEWRAAMRA